jgi:hypothetical protein
MSVARGLARLSLVLLAAGAVAAPVVAHGDPAPACFGAAARDPLHPCRNPRLRLTVRPDPRKARTLPNASCRKIGEIEGKRICDWGAPAEQATATIALVGDSHAGMWRVALNAAAQAKDWRGISVGHAGCPLSKAVRDLPGPTRSHCNRWRKAVFKWFGKHPEVSVVFAGQLAGGSGVLPRGGRSRFETAVRGYEDAWKALPPTVRHIVVIRDDPRVRSDSDDCILRAVARKQSPGVACALSRRSVLDPDPAATAAARLRSPRVQAIEFTPFFCGSRLCYPVIGGALVHTDTHHLTATFAETLGPYMLRDIDRLSAGWAP